MISFSDSDDFEFENLMAEGLENLQSKEKKNRPSFEDGQKLVKELIRIGRHGENYRSKHVLSSDEEYEGSQAVEVSHVESDGESEPDDSLDIAPINRYDQSTDDDRYEQYISQLSQPVKSAKDFIVRSDSENEEHCTQANNHSMGDFIVDDDKSITEESSGEDALFYHRTNNLLDKCDLPQKRTPKNKKKKKYSRKSKEDHNIKALEKSTDCIDLLSDPQDEFDSPIIKSTRRKNNNVIESDDENSFTSSTYISNKDVKTNAQTLNSILPQQMSQKAENKLSQRRHRKLYSSEISTGKENADEKSKFDAVFDDSDTELNELLLQACQNNSGLKDEPCEISDDLTYLKPRQTSTFSILSQPEDLFSDSDSDFDTALYEGLKMRQTPSKGSQFQTPAQKLRYPSSRKSDSNENECSWSEDDVIFVTDNIDTPAPHKTSQPHQPTTRNSTKSVTTPLKTMPIFTPLKNNKRLVQETLTPQRKFNKPAQTTSTPSSKRPPLSMFTRTEPRRPVYLSFLSSLSEYIPADKRRDQHADTYVKNFKKYREDLTEKLKKIYNMKVFSNKLLDVPIKWNKRLLKTAGQCVYMRTKTSKTRTATIELSEKVCHNTERLRDTLIHEMCHAAVWIINEVQDGHGRYWQWWTMKAQYELKDIPLIRRCHTYEIQTKYTYQCIRCGNKIGRHSKSLDVNRKCCGLCRGEFRLVGSNSENNNSQTPSKTPNKFAMFVKENYGSVRKGRSGLSHGDVMKELSNAFKNNLELA